MHRPSLAEYLVWEAAQTERNEFWRGEVFTMVGARRGHGRVVANLMRHLGNHLDGTPHQAFSENMKIQVRDEAVLYASDPTAPRSATSVHCGSWPSQPSAGSAN